MTMSEIDRLSAFSTSKTKSHRTEKNILCETDCTEILSETLPQTLSTTSFAKSALELVLRKSWNNSKTKADAAPPCFKPKAEPGHLAMRFGHGQAKMHTDTQSTLCWATRQSFATGAYSYGDCSHSLHLVALIGRVGTVEAIVLKLSY